MGTSAVMWLGGRMASRNYLYIFAWLCATAVPLVLQSVTGLMEEVRDYLAYYYGDLSLFMFFVMTYGFASVFVSYYLVGGYRLAGTLDILRLSQISPWEISAGVFLAVLKVILPPLLLFVSAFGIYLAIGSQGSFISDEPWWVLVGMASLIIANMLILSLIPCLGIFRRNSLLALVGVVLVLPLNAMPVLLVYVFKMPVWLYSVILAGTLVMLFLTSVFLVTRTWPAQRLPLD